MPLTWDATEVADYDNLTDDECVAREALIFATMGVGINHITEDNAREFYERVSFIEKVNGASRHGWEDGEHVPVYFTPDEIRRFIGLRTNASVLTKAKFKTNVYEGHVRWNVKW